MLHSFSNAGDLEKLEISEQVFNIFTELCEDKYTKMLQDQALLGVHVHEHGPKKEERFVKRDASSIKEICKQVKKALEEAIKLPKPEPEFDHEGKEDNPFDADEDKAE